MCELTPKLQRKGNNLGGAKELWFKSRTKCNRKLMYSNPEGQGKSMVRGQIDGQLNGEPEK